ncbi:hypothetical protein [Compostibacter hankyongensis]|uniref:hypothetical protein n=1 Tax=Compostibacter hankyongensis TaxID=1007089 RepID=UPI0031EF3BF2
MSKPLAAAASACLLSALAGVAAAAESLCSSEVREDGLLQEKSPASKNKPIKVKVVVLCIIYRFLGIKADNCLLQR